MSCSANSSGEAVFGRVEPIPTSAALGSPLLRCFSGHSWGLLAPCISQSADATLRTRDAGSMIAVFLFLACFSSVQRGAGAPLAMARSLLSRLASWVFSPRESCLDREGIAMPFATQEENR